MTIAAAAIWLIVPLTALLLLGVPISLAMAATGMAYLMITVEAWATGASILFSSLDKTPVLAIPFFILAAAGNPVIQEGSIGMMVFAV